MDWQASVRERPVLRQCHASDWIEIHRQFGPIWFALLNIFQDPTGEVGVARRDRVGANDLGRLWKREVGHVVDDHRLGSSARSIGEVSLSYRDT